jgi:hypothetical protein
MGFDFCEWWQEDWLFQRSNINIYFFFNLLFVFQRRLCDEEDFIKKKFIEGTRI